MKSLVTAVLRRRGKFDIDTGREETTMWKNQ